MTSPWYCVGGYAAELWWRDVPDYKANPPGSFGYKNLATRLGISEQCIEKMCSHPVSEQGVQVRLSTITRRSVVTGLRRLAETGEIYYAERVQP